MFNNGGYDSFSVLIIGHGKILIEKFLYRGTDYKIVKYGLYLLIRLYILLQ